MSKFKLMASPEKKEKSEPVDKQDTVRIVLLYYQIQKLPSVSSSSSVHQSMDREDVSSESSLETRKTFISLSSQRKQSNTLSEL